MQECPSMPVWTDYVKYQVVYKKDGYSFTLVHTTPRYILCRIVRHLWIYVMEGIPDTKVS